MSSHSLPLQLPPTLSKYKPTVFKTSYGYCVETEKVSDKESKGLSEKLATALGKIQEAHVFQQADKTLFLLGLVSWKSMELSSLLEKYFSGQAASVLSLYEAVEKKPSNYIRQRFSQALSEKGLQLLQKKAILEGKKFLIYSAFQNHDEKNSHLNLGKLYKIPEFLDLEIAEFHFIHLLRLSPDHLTGNLELGELYLRKNEFSKAIPYLEKYLSLKADDPKGDALLGKAKMALKKYEEAKNHFLHAMKTNSEYLPIYIPLTQCYLAQKNHERARLILKLYMEREKKDPQSYHLLADIYLYQGQLKKAKKNFKRALKLNPDDMEAYRQLAEIYEVMGDFPKCRKIMKKYDRWKKLIDLYGGLRHDIPMEEIEEEELESEEEIFLDDD